MRASEFMRTKDMRANARVQVSRKGALKSGNFWFPCLIENMSENGLLVMSNRVFPVGQVLEFRCELFPRKLLNCKLKVKHVHDTVLGTQVIEIDQTDNGTYQMFLGEQYAHRGIVRRRQQSSESWIR